MAGATALGAVAVLMTGGQRSGPSGPASSSVMPSMEAVWASKSPSPGAGTGGSLTLTQAQAVLARYTTVNNSANAQRSKTMLAAVETGSSYAIDAGLYQEQQAEGTALYPAFGPVQATYYIPRDQPASGPQWFVPGFYSPAQALSRAGVSDLEQFAAYDPPAGGGAPRIVADYSGITGTS